MAPALGLNIGVSSPALAQAAPDGMKWRHAISTFGDIKYPADFKRFDYVNPDAPKGGVARLFELGSYDSFNIVTRPSMSRTAITARWPNSSPTPKTSPM
jgi:microcin C transport system substrate-binding protein